MDSSVSETYGRAAGHGLQRALRVHACYHPLFLFNQFGDLERAMLRRGNHASAKFWRRVLLPVIERYRHLDIPKFFRGDAAFANPALYRVLEKEGYRYVIRLKANAVLEREIEHLLKRPVGRPSRKPKVFYHSFQYQAKSWHQPRRVVAKVEWHAGRTVSPRGLHRDQLEQAVEERGEVLQRSRHCRAVDQGRVRTPSNGRSSPAARSRTTRPGCSCSRWPTTWPTSCGGWRCPRVFGNGR